MYAIKQIESHTVALWKTTSESQYDYTTSQLRLYSTEERTFSYQGKGQNSWNLRYIFVDKSEGEARFTEL